MFNTRRQERVSDFKFSRIENNVQLWPEHLDNLSRSQVKSSSEEPASNKNSLAPMKYECNN